MEALISVLILLSVATTVLAVVALFKIRHLEARLHLTRRDLYITARTVVDQLKLKQQYAENRRRPHLHVVRIMEDMKQELRDVTPAGKREGQS